MDDELSALTRAEPLGNTYKDLSHTSDLVGGGSGGQSGGVSQAPVRRQMESNPPPVLDSTTRRRRLGSLGGTSVTSKPAVSSVRQQRRSSLGFAAPTETSVRRASIGSEASVGSSASARRSATRKPIQSSSSSSKDKSGLSTAQLDAHTAETGTISMLENGTAKTSKKKGSGGPKGRRNGWEDDDLESIASSIQSSVRRRRVAPRPLPVNRPPPEPVPPPAVNGPGGAQSPVSKIPSAPSPATAKQANQPAVQPSPGSPTAPRLQDSVEPGTITTITISDMDSDGDPQTGTVSVSPMTSGNRSAKLPHPFVQEMDEYNEPVPRKDQPTSFQSPKPSTKPTAASSPTLGNKSKTRAASTSSAAAAQEVVLSPLAGERKGSTKATRASPTPVKPLAHSNGGNPEARRGSNASDGVAFRVEDSDSNDDDLETSGRTPLHVLRERAKGEQAMNAMREDGDQQAPVVPPLPLFELSARRDREAATANKTVAPNPAPATASLSGASVSVSTITGTPTPRVASRRATPKVTAVANGKPAPSKPQPDHAANHGTRQEGSGAAAAAADRNEKPTTQSPPSAAQNPPSAAPATGKDGGKCCIVM